QVLRELQRLRRCSAAIETPASEAASVARSLATDRYEPGAAQTPASATLPAGGSESSVLTDPGRRYWPGAARSGEAVAAALAYAHQQGVVHRDIRPSTLLLDPQGTVWVTDFGLAKGSDSDDLTVSGEVVGTLRYIPPERFQGKSDAAGDVYSLGM